MQFLGTDRCFFLRMGYLQLLQLFFLVLGVTQGNNFISSIVPIAGHRSGLDPVSLQWQTANLSGPQQVGQGYAVGAGDLTGQRWGGQWGCGRGVKGYGAFLPPPSPSLTSRDV